MTRSSASSLILLIVVATDMFAQGTSNGGSFLKIPYFAARGSLAESGSAEVMQTEGVLLNPASTFGREGVSLLVSHGSWIQGTELNALLFQISSPIGRLGVAIGSSAIPGIEIREIPGVASGTFTARSGFLNAHWSGSLSEDLTVGAAAKLLYEKIFIDDATGYAADVGLVYSSPIAGLTFGSALLNLGSLGTFRDEATSLPTTLRIGTSYTRETDDFTVTLNADYANEFAVPSGRILVGGAIEYNSLLTLRTGYQSGLWNRGFSAGIGIRYGVLMIDYAYLPIAHAQDAAQFLTVGFQFQ